MSGVHICVFPAPLFHFPPNILSPQEQRENENRKGKTRVFISFSSHDAGGFLWNGSNFMVMIPTGTQESLHLGPEVSGVLASVYKQNNRRKPNQHTGNLLAMFFLLKHVNVSTENPGIYCTFLLLLLMAAKGEGLQVRDS